MMFQLLKRMAVAWCLCLTSITAIAAEPVKTIGVYVRPYYEASQSGDGRPRVDVAKQYDNLLSSNKQKDIIAVRDMIQKEPQLITPMTLMVLAIRLYDVGLRDDSVFWFYVAKNRFFTLAGTLEMRSSALSQVVQATSDFATLAGPIINGYAFCNINKQKEQRLNAIEWVEKNPYQAIFFPQLPAKPGDRQANLAQSLENIRKNAQEEMAYLNQPENIAALTEGRTKSGADAKFCW